MPLAAHGTWMSSRARLSVREAVDRTFDRCVGDSED